MPVRRAGRRPRQVVPTARFLRVATDLATWGPLTERQFVRMLGLLVPELACGGSASRLRRRELARLRAAKFLGERFLPDGERVFWITPGGEEVIAGLGQLAERRGDVARPYFARPVHNRLVKEVALTCLEARYAPDLFPRIVRLAWEERAIWTVPDPELPGPSVDLEPDGVLWVRVEGTPGTLLWAVEADTGEERLDRQWREKVEKYRRWAALVAGGKFLLPADVDPEKIRVLVVPTNQTRCRNLAQATAELLGDDPPIFLFATTESWETTKFWKPIWIGAGRGLRPEGGLVSLRILSSKPKGGA